MLGENSKTSKAIQILEEKEVNIQTFAIQIQ